MNEPDWAADVRARYEARQPGPNVQKKVSDLTEDDVVVVNPSDDSQDIYVDHIEFEGGWVLVYEEAMRYRADQVVDVRGRCS